MSCAWFALAGAAAVALAFVAAHLIAMRVLRARHPEGSGT